MKFESMCGDCAVEEGELHEPGCDQETCSKCRIQKIRCNCKVPNEEREPHFSHGWSCVRCGEFMASIDNMVSDKKWINIPNQIQNIIEERENG